MPDDIGALRPLDFPQVAGVEHRFVEVNGARLHIAEAGPVAAGPAGAGEPDSAPLLLLHGFPQHWYLWRDMLAGLGRTRRVLALDLRGFGWSSATRRGYSTKARVADVLAVLDELNIATVDVIGHDWGGWLGFRLAIDHPDRVGRLVSIAMVHPWVMQRHLLPHVWRWWVTALFELPGVGEWMLRRRPSVTGWLLTRDTRRPAVWTPDLQAIYVQRAAEGGAARAGRQLHTQLVLRDIPRLLLGRDRRRSLQVPTLIIGGEHDALLPPGVLTVPGRFTDVIDVRTIGGGHYLVDEFPDEVMALVAQHLDAPTGSRRCPPGPSYGNAPPDGALP